MSDEQKELIKKADEYPYKNCREESKNLKYTAPTEACKLASEEMSRYRQCDSNLKMNTVNTFLNHLKTTRKPVNFTVDSFFANRQ